MPIEIKVLDTLNGDDLKRIATTVTAWEKYVVTKTETDERTTITLDLVKLDTPYVKEFSREDDLIGWYKHMIGHGLCLGAFDSDASPSLIGITVVDIQEWNDSAILWEFHVAESYRGKGVGRQLMDALVERAKAKNLDMIVVETSSTNVGAVRFYRKVGFEVKSIDLAYYGSDDLERGDVVVFMARKL
jgi:ribosomal protein S18 acetylase RimI-like enzyme